MAKIKAEELEKMTIAELESHLDKENLEEGKTYLRSVMEVRNRKIRQAELDHWGLTEEEHAAACLKAEAYNRSEGDLDAAETQLRRVKRAIEEAIKSKTDTKDLEAKAEKAFAEVEKCRKTLTGIVKQNKLTVLQEAQRKALRELRPTQMVRTIPAVVGVKGK